MSKSNFTPSPIPEPGEGKRGKEGYLGYLLRQAAAAHRRAMDHALASLDVTMPQFLTLTMLSSYPGCSNAELARIAFLTPQTVNLIVANLERRGLIERRPHAQHGRIQQLALSDRGHALLKRCKERTGALDKQLCQGLTAAEEEVVRGWLVKVATAF